jgi:hypothetical protein
MNTATYVTTNTTWWHFDVVTSILLVTARVTIVGILPIFKKVKKQVEKQNKNNVRYMPFDYIGIIKLLYGM